MCSIWSPIYLYFMVQCCWKSANHHHNFNHNLQFVWQWTCWLWRTSSCVNVWKTTSSVDWVLTLVIIIDIILIIIIVIALYDSGHVDSEELRRVLTECGRMKLTEEEANEFIGGATSSLWGWRGCWKSRSYHWTVGKWIHRWCNIIIKAIMIIDIRNGWHWHWKQNFLTCFFLISIMIFHS